MTNSKIRTAAAAVGAAAVFGGAFSAPATAAPSTSARAGVCAGVKNCHRVATIDVDGDRRADRVGWRQINRNKVQIRVRTADGELLKRTVGVRKWPGGGTWGDAAWIDGHRGAELLIGTVAGAHTTHYRMLTYRNGRLVGEKSPWRSSIGGRWAVDASARFYAGWDRNVGKRGRVTMTMKSAERNRNGRGFHGFNVRYAWHNGHWKRVKRIDRTYRTQRQARKIAGWHVGHLDRWPS